MSEPFGYFKAEPFGWTDCAETDEGAVALYTAPPAQEIVCSTGLCHFKAQHQKPVALKWQQAPIRTVWGNEMVVASVAIDNDHTLSLYCERDQTPKVEAMLAQRTWTGLTHDEWDAWQDKHGLMLGRDALDEIDAKLKEKNQ